MHTRSALPSEKSNSLEIMHWVRYDLWLWHAAGTVSYVKDEWSPIAAEVDCLGPGDEDINREGRYGRHAQTPNTYLCIKCKT